MMNDQSGPKRYELNARMYVGETDGKISCVCIFCMLFSSTFICYVTPYKKYEKNLYKKLSIQMLLKILLFKCIKNTTKNVSNNIKAEHIELFVVNRYLVGIIRNRETKIKLPISLICDF